MSGRGVGVYDMRLAPLLTSGTEARGVLGVGNIPVAKLSSSQYVKIIAL